jgi:MarR family transcriptional repressor of emrRAB
MADEARRSNLLGAFALAVTDRLRYETEAASGLSGEAAAALAVIAQQPGGTVETLRRAIGRSQPATVRIVDRLAERDYVRRRPSGHGPALALELTVAGRERARELLAARARVLDAVLATLDADAARALEDVLERGLTALADMPAGLMICRMCDKARCRRTQDCPVVSCLEAQGVTIGPSQPL